MDDAYRIGITIAMTTNASTVLQGVRRDVVALGGLVDKLTGSLATARTAMKGLATPFVGTAAVSAMGALADAGKDLVQRQALFHQQLRQIPGITPGKPIDETTSTAARVWKAANDAVTSGVADNLNRTRPLMQGFGDIARARRDPTTIAPAQSLAVPIRGNQSGDQVFDTLKRMKPEAISPGPRDVTRLLDATIKAAVAAGRLFGSNLRGAFEPARTATPDRSDQAIGSSPAALIGALKPGGGQSATTELGRGLIAAVPATLGGPPPNKAALQLECLPPTHRTSLIGTSTSAMNGSSPRGTAGPGESPPIPYQWVRNVPLPPLRSAGIADPDKVHEMITRSATAHPEPPGPAENTVPTLGAIATTAGMFAVGTAAATALGVLAGPAGLRGLAAGIMALGKALPKLPHGVVDTTASAALGAAIGSSVPGVGTVTGTGLGAATGPTLGAVPARNQPRFATGGIWVNPGPAVPPSVQTSAAANGPMRVYVVNGHDLANGTTAHQASQLSLPPSGPSNADPRMHLPMPGLGAPAVIGP